MLRKGLAHGRGVGQTDAKARETAMEFRPLHRDLGVEVIGFDVSAGRSAADVAALVSAYDRHKLLLFRGRAVSPERQLEIAGWFGPPDPVRDEGGRAVSELDNAEMAGSVALPFHSDLTYTEETVSAICLHAVALPSAPTVTSFVSGVAAWQRLPADLRDRVAGLSAHHVLDSSVTGWDWPRFDRVQPVRLSHPRTGEPVLHVTEHHAEAIEGMDPEAGRALLARLFAELYAADARYDHVWQPDDLVMWDNVALQHARPERSDPAGGPRTLRRVALARLGYHELLERQRARVA